MTSLDRDNPSTNESEGKINEFNLSEKTAIFILEYLSISTPLLDTLPSSGKTIRDLEEVSDPDGSLRARKFFLFDSLVYSKIKCSGKKSIVKVFLFLSTSRLVY